MSEPSPPEISIVVPNWNGETLLEEGLGSLWRSASLSGRPFELIVVDDCSQDNSPSLIRERFAQVRLLENRRNLGFARTSNKGVLAAQARVVVLVNNDVIAPDDFIAHITAPFFETDFAPPDEAPLFAVGAKTVDWESGEPNHLCMNAAWRRGGIGKVYTDPKERCPTTYVQGGAAAYDRDLFLVLGGFDAIFAPGYWEDYDLSYRAAKVGWRVLYEPRAVARHVGKASLLGLLGARRLAQIDERNRLFFNWLNLEDRALFARHVLALPWVYARDLWTLKGGNGIIGFLRALWGLPALCRLRRLRRRSDPPPVRTDRELLANPAPSQAHS